MSFDGFMDKVVWGPQDAVKKTKRKIKSVPRRVKSQIKSKVTPDPEKVCDKLGHVRPKNVKKGKTFNCERCGSRRLGDGF